MTAAPAILALPQPVRSEVWVSQDEALRLANRKRAWLFAEQQSGRIQSRPTARVQANGRFAREYALSTLPKDAQRRYEAERQYSLLEARPARLPLLGGPQLVTRKRVRIPAAQMSEAESKHSVLQPILAMREESARRIYADTLRLADGKPVNSQNRMIAYQIEQAAARGEALNKRTIMRWLKRYNDEPGVGSLAKRQRRDAGQSRFFAQPENEAAAVLLAYLYLGDDITPGLSVHACYEMLIRQRELVGLAQRDLPDYHTVRRFLARITPALKVFARRGRKEFAERMLPYISRAYTEPANSIWVSDTMIADVEVLNDCIPGAPQGAPVRLRLTAIIDYRSRYVVGYSWAWEGSSASIASALRHAVMDHGPCELWYCDNGKDYCKVAKGAVPGYMQPGSVEAEDWALREMKAIENTGVLARLGIRVTHCLAHHPQSKHVERFFRTLHLTFCKLWPTYTGGKPSERPDQTTALMAVHRRAMRKGDLRQSHHPLASEFIARFEQWLPTYQNKRGHRGQGMNYGSPAEVFQSTRNQAQRPAPTAEQLAYLLWEHTTAKVRECQVRVNKHDYAPLDGLQSRLMLDRNERIIPVAYDPLDPSCVAVLDDAGHLITVLQAKRLLAMAPEDPETKAQIKEMQQRRAMLTRGLKEDRLSVVRAAKQIGVVQPLQLLAASAGSPEVSVATTERITPRKPRLESSPATKAPKYAHELAASILRRKETR